LVLVAHIVWDYESEGIQLKHTPVLDLDVGALLAVQSLVFFVFHQKGLNSGNTNPVLDPEPIPLPLPVV
jgi:hypothetical protein